jgi:hypothetical protein
VMTFAERAWVDGLFKNTDRRSDAHVLPIWGDLVVDAGEVVGCTGLLFASVLKHVALVLEDKYTNLATC